MKTILHRDDNAALALAKRLGKAVPQVFEEIRDEAGTHFRRAVCGYLVKDEGGGVRGYVLLAGSDDGEDWEIHAEGGWCVSAMRELFRVIFIDGQQPRVSARCKASNSRNIRALERMGFRREGRKRLGDDDTIHFGMLREECRFLKGGADGHLQNAEAA